MVFEEKFFEKEVREGFEISSMMKRAWAAELEVLFVIAEICKKYNITWFADGGTVLGAVRHQGFIPWDDDIDICLRREDYNRLLAVLPEELPYGFVIAGLHAKEKRLQDVAARIMHLRVIADETKWDFNDYMKYFHGFPYQRIGIDIFPYDYIPRDKELEDGQKEILRFGILTVQYWGMWEEKGELEDRIFQIEKSCHVQVPKDGNRYNIIWRIVDAVSGACRSEDADELANYIFFLEKDGLRMKKEWYRDAVYLPFEQRIEMPVPVGYEGYLRHTYGDWRKPVKNGAKHGYPFYGQMEQELERQIRATGFKGTTEDFCREVAAGNFVV